MVNFDLNRNVLQNDIYDLDEQTPNTLKCVYSVSIEKLNNDLNVNYGSYLINAILNKTNMFQTIFHDINDKRDDYVFDDYLNSYSQSAIFHNH